MISSGDVPKLLNQGIQKALLICHVSGSDEGAYNGKRDQDTLPSVHFGRLCGLSDGEREEEVRNFKVLS